MLPELGILMLPGLLVMGISFSLVVLAFCAYYRLKGIERAMWAVVSQLQAIRRELPAPTALAASPGPETDALLKRHVANSMFGR
ncbi:MAG TPA: hypothetical protein VJY15_11335 [Candidatus Acidoferrum sp.]|nr:hypothetical protein [Candidatus Acidoferrum sp.]